MYTVGEGLMYTVGEGVNVYCREGLIYTIDVPNSETLYFHSSIHEDVPQSVHDVLQQKVPHPTH